MRSFAGGSGAAPHRRRWIAMIAIPALLATACSDTVETAKEAVSLPFKVYRDSKSYVGEETVTLATAEANGRRIRLSCLLVRPLTGSFWGGRDYYAAHFNYEWTFGAAKTTNRYAPPLRSVTRDPIQARPLCRKRASVVVAHADGAGFEIRVDGRVVATVADDGTLSPK